MNSRSQIIKYLLDDIVKNISRVSVSIQALQVNLNMSMSPLRFLQDLSKRKHCTVLGIKITPQNAKKGHSAWKASKITKKLVRDWE